MSEDTYAIRIPELRTSQRDDESDAQWINYIMGFYQKELPNLPQATITELTCMTSKYLRGDPFTRPGVLFLGYHHCRAAFEKAVGVALPPTITGTMAVLNRN